MKLLVAAAFALLMMVQFAGCARQAATTSPMRSNMTSSQPVGSGLRPASMVQPCCRPLAEGRISLDQCMENPACKANNRMCCIHAIE